MISVGDLVIVVRAHCEGNANSLNGGLGTIHTVVRITRNEGMCGACGRHIPTTNFAQVDDLPLPEALPIDYLRRIPPLHEMEEQHIGIPEHA